jgi:hypothetical protein
MSDPFYVPMSPFEVIDRFARKHQSFCMQEQYRREFALAEYGAMADGYRAASQAANEAYLRSLKAAKKQVRQQVLNEVRAQCKWYMSWNYRKYTLAWIKKLIRQYMRVEHERITTYYFNEMPNEGPFLRRWDLDTNPTWAAIGLLLYEARCNPESNDYMVPNSYLDATEEVTL